MDSIDIPVMTVVQLSLFLLPVSQDYAHSNLVLGFSNHTSPQRYMQQPTQAQKQSLHLTVVHI